MTRPTLLIAACYAILAALLLTPMASNTAIPFPPEHASHTALIVQARMAIDDGQFPIRVAPWQHRGWQYPVFQFYSPLPYTVAALIYRWLTPQNPFVAYKLTIGIALLLGGLFVHLTARRLTASRAAGFVAGVVYMTTPYWLVNIHSRGAFTEAVAQGVLPIAIYASLRAWRETRTVPASIWTLTAGVAWSALALTHTITHLTGAVFVGLLFVLLTIFTPAIDRRAAMRGLPRVGGGFALGCLLAMYFLAPVAMSDGLMIRERIGNVFAASWLTPLSSLLSPIARPPVPLPDSRLPPHFSAAIGWPLLAGAIVVLMTWRRKVELTWRQADRPRAGDRAAEAIAGAREGDRARDAIAGAREGDCATGAMASRGRDRGVLLALFALAILTAWSPFDFWSWLPPAAQVVQFNYRLLSQVAWTGALLTAFAVTQATGGRSRPFAIAASVALILIATISFLPPAIDAKVDLRYLVSSPDMGWGQDDYLFDPKQLRPPPQAADAGSESTMPVESLTPAHCARLRDHVSCHLVVADRPTRAQLPVLFYPGLIDLRVNGSDASYFPMPHGNFVLTGVRLEPGTYDADARFRGLPWANWISGLSALATAIALVVLIAAPRRRKQDDLRV